MYFHFVDQTLFFQSPTENITNPQRNSKYSLRTNRTKYLFCNTILAKKVCLLGVSDFIFAIYSYEI